jgi:hypothetical protein
MHLIPPISSIHTSHLPTIFSSQGLLLQYTGLTNTFKLDISSHFSYMDCFFFLFLLLTFPFSFIHSLLRLHPCAFGVARRSFFFVLGYRRTVARNPLKMRLARTLPLGFLTAADRSIQSAKPPSEVLGRMKQVSMVRISCVYKRQALSLTCIIYFYHIFVDLYTSVFDGAD